MARRRNDYAGTVLGQCGHVCNSWPTVQDRKSGKNKVVCDECEDWVLINPPGQIPGQLSLLDDEPAF